MFRPVRQVAPPGAKLLSTIAGRIYVRFIITVLILVVVSTERRYMLARYMQWPDVRLSVWQCLPVRPVLSKRLNISSRTQDAVGDSRLRPGAATWRTERRL